MDPAQAKARDCWTVTEAAKSLGVGRTTLYSAIESGALKPTLTADGTPLILKSEGERWKRQRNPAGRPKKQGARKIEFVQD